MSECATCNKQFERDFEPECHCMCCWAENCMACNCDECCDKENERLEAIRKNYH